jgi:hypothetical protein
MERKRSSDRVAILKQNEKDFTESAVNEPRRVSISSKAFDRGYDDAIEGRPHRAHKRQDSYDKGFSTAIEELWIDDRYS